MKQGARIVGGRFGGRRLDVAAGVRPTPARIREAVASIWNDRLAGARLLDCFAGSGAFSVEMVGRGVAGATLVERSPKVLATLRRNLSRLDAEIDGRSPFTLVRLDLPTGVRRLDGVFDLVFADPPYAFTDHGRLLSGLRPRLAEGGELAIEHARSGDIEPGDGWVVVDRRRYGDSAVTFLRPE